MRAIYLPEIQETFETITISDDKARQLLKVARIKVGEKILVLNGKGTKFTTEVTGTSRKDLVLSFVKSENKEKSLEISLLVGKVKKDALDLTLKMAVEMGVSNIFIANTSYSQNYPLKTERLNKLIEAAMEQSNNLFLPSYEEVTFSKFDFSQFDSKVCFSSSEGEQETSIELNGRILLVVGPEGGFSKEEEEQLCEKVNGKIKLDIPIMRTPTAVACGLGYLQALMVNPKV